MNYPENIGDLPPPIRALATSLCDKFSSLVGVSLPGNITCDDLGDYTLSMSLEPGKVFNLDILMSTYRSATKDYAAVARAQPLMRGSASMLMFTLSEVRSQGTKRSTDSLRESQNTPAPKRRHVTRATTRKSLLSRVFGGASQ